MFARRLTAFWILLTLVALVIAGRLVHIQVFRHEHYEDLADKILTRPVRYLSAPRGTIYDRDGHPLLEDRPSFDIAIHYAVLAGQRSYLSSVARAMRRRGEFPADMQLSEITARLESDHIHHMWQRLCDLTGEPMQTFLDRAAVIRQRVQRVKAAVQRRSPTVTRIAEENQLLPVLKDVDKDIALQIRLELEHLPWIRVVPSTRRVAHHADSLCHVLGQLGAASPERIISDPLRDSELRRLRPGDRCGTRGVERLAETSLRGTRGRIVEDFDRRIIERIDPKPGRDVALTIDTELQDLAVKLLGEAVEKCVHPSGGAAVVIDVDSREVLALASYPTFEYEALGEDYGRLRRDMRRRPLLFRAVAAQYPPGSICKAISLIGGLTEGVVTTDTRFHCTGFLLPNKPNRFRCWIYNQHPGLTHDMTDDPNGQDGESAVRNSCNIYFFKVGGRLGPDRLCHWFEEFGLGRPPGTGLIEESPGIVPDEQWMQRVAGRSHRPADAWNFAIGQGEVTVTPLQAANVAATVASGYWAPAHLAYDDTGQALGAPPVPVKMFRKSHMDVLRRGMWRVVNERGGTAPTARIDSDEYEFCGKTGSAQTVPLVLNRRYICEWPDGSRESVIAISKRDALARFEDEKPEIVGWRAHERYPALHEGEKLPAHAWFIGYTQRKSTPRGDMPRGKVYAISTIVEFGGSGGRVAAPVAKQLAEYLVAQHD